MTGITDVIGKVIGFVNNRWGVNKKAQELEELGLEISQNKEVLESVKAFQEFTLQYEGRAAELSKALQFLRAGWRPMCIWAFLGLLAYKTIIGEVSLNELQTTMLTIVGPLFGLRTIEKKLLK